MTRLKRGFTKFHYIVKINTSRKTTLQKSKRKDFFYYYCPLKLFDRTKN